MLGWPGKTGFPVRHSFLASLSGSCPWHFVTKPIDVARNSNILLKTEGTIFENAHSRFGLNGVQAPFSVSPEAQSWCVIRHKARHFVRPIAEMRKHTQGKKCYRKVCTLRSEWGYECLLVIINSRMFNQFFLVEIRIPVERDLETTIGNSTKIGCGGQMGIWIFLCQ